MIGSKPVARIERADVLTVLNPIWSTRPRQHAGASTVADDLFMGDGVWFHCRPIQREK